MPAVDDALRGAMNGAGELVHHPSLTTALAVGLSGSTVDPQGAAQSASLGLDVVALRELQAEAQELNG